MQRVESKLSHALNCPVVQAIFTCSEDGAGVFDRGILSRAPWPRNLTNQLPVTWSWILRVYIHVSFSSDKCAGLRCPGLRNVLEDDPRLLTLRLGTTPSQATYKAQPGNAPVAEAVLDSCRTCCVRHVMESWERHGKCAHALRRYNVNLVQR